MEYPKKGGLKWESFKFTDYSFDKVYGSAPQEELIPLKRDISGVPVVFQGSENTCVSCSITWIRQYLDLQKTPLSWQWLAKISHTSSNGATPSQVLEPARKIGILDKENWIRLTPTQENSAIFFSTQAFADVTSKYRIGSYFFLHKLDKTSIYHALKKGPIAIGVDDWGGVGPHMMVAYDITDDATALKCVNWWNPSVQDEVAVPFSKVELAISFGELPVTIDTKNIRLSMLTVLRDKLDFLPWKKVLASISIALLAFLGFATQNNDEEKALGASSVASGYRSTVSSGMTASQTTVPVSSVTLTSSETLTTSTLRLGEGIPVYLKINPGGATEELVECYGLSSLTFDRCGRGIGYTGTGTTSTISARQFPHAAGETVIMSNDAPFFNRFVDTYTNQSVTGTKTFTGAGGRVDIGDNTTTTCKFIYFQTGQSSEPYYKICGPSAGSTTSTFYFSLDGSSDLQLNASGTTAGASSTRGIFLTNGLFGINASSTGGIGFDASGLALVNVSSTASTNGGFIKRTFTSTNEIYWDVVNFLAGAWTWVGNQIFSGTVALNGAVTIAGNTTSTGNFSVAATPVLAGDVVNKSYLENAIANNVGTSTAAHTITAGQALYITSTSTAAQTNSSVATSTFSFIGLATNSVSAGATVSYTKPGGVNCNQSSLIPGRTYYLNGTAGQVTSTAGTYVARIGVALTSTCLQVNTPYYRNSGTITVSAVSTGATSVVFNPFFPAKLSFRSAGVGGNFVRSFSMGDLYGSLNCYDGATNSCSTDTSNTVYVLNSDAASWAGTVAQSALGFTVTHTNLSGGGTLSASILWAAESL